MILTKGFTAGISSLFSGFLEVFLSKSPLFQGLMPAKSKLFYLSYC